MAKQYLQPLMMFPAAAGGTCVVYIYNTTTKAALYNPNTLAPISNPVSIDSAGVVDAFVVDSGITYDIDVMDSFGNSVWSTERIDVFETVDDVGLQLGETSTTAYRGDRGKTAYDHSQTTGNPHGAVAADVGAASALHASQHGYGASDPVSVDTRQISNMTPFARSLVDDATAADARATLEASPLNTTLSNNAGSTTLPTTTSGSLVSKIQALRDNVVSLFASVAGKVNKGADAIMNGGTVNYWGKVFEITGMGPIYNRGVFAIAWGVHNGSYYQGELQVEVSGSDADPLINLRQLGPVSTALFTAVRNGTTWEIWAKQTFATFNVMLFNIKFAAISNISGFTTTATSASVSGTLATVYRYITQSQSDAINNAVLVTGDQTIGGSKTFSATPTIPELPPESVGGDAANARFVADKIYPNFMGTDITASGSVTLVHGEMRVINANGLTVTLTNTPALGTVSWLYFSPTIGCSNSTLTLSFYDPVGTVRTYQKSATVGSNHLPHWIKCTRCLQGWSIEWETEA